MNVGWSGEDVLFGSVWTVGVNMIAIRLRLTWPPSIVGILPDHYIEVNPVNPVNPANFSCWGKVQPLLTSTTKWNTAATKTK